MTIAEQITRAKADYDEVYQTAHRNGINKGFTDGYTVGYSNGKASMIDESKIIEKTVTGSIISVDDVSEIPHEVSIQLSSDTVTDFSNVTVKAVGKNLATAQQVWKGMADYTETTNDGRNVVSFLTSSTVRNNLPIFEENAQYVISFEGKTTVNSTSSALSSPFIYVYYTDGTTSVFGTTTAPTDWKRYEFVTTADKTVKAVGMNSYTYTVTHWVDVNTFQFEKATVATEYEPYNETAYTPNANGTVEGITSISPRMTVFTDESNVDITMDYHMSYGAWLRWNKDWDIKQKYGTQRNYWGAFTSGYNDANFDPKYSIIAADCGYMFMYTRITNINVDIDLSESANANNLMPYTYGTLKKVKKIILKNDGSQTFLNAFASASGLTEIFFDGVIGKDISFAQSTLLNEASFINIFEHFSTTASFTATFAKNAVINTFGSTTAAKWTNLVASRPNVTIALV